MSRTVITPLVLCILSACATSAQTLPANLTSFEAYLREKMPELSVPDRTKITPFSIIDSDKAPVWLPEGFLRDEHPLADNVSGLIAPKYPFEELTEILPMDDPRTSKYLGELDRFHNLRHRVLQLEAKYEQEVASFKMATFITSDIDYIAKKINSWNGEIFWAPASAVDLSGNPSSQERVTQHGDEIRAVLGPIPPFDPRNASNLRLEVEGNLVELKPNTSKLGSPLEFEHRDVNGNVVKWTEALPECDKPSLAGGVTFCGFNSRVKYQQTSGNVYWLLLARKSKGLEVQAIDYWLASNNEYQLVGHIGFNKITGEIAFLDSDPNKSFSFEDVLPPPGGSGYSDVAGRKAAREIYDGRFAVSCHACHDNLDPATITPYIKQARVGYADASLSAAYSLGELFPKAIRKKDKPYRVFGSGFVSAKPNPIKQGRLIEDPLGKCSTCHELTNLGTGNFAADAASFGEADVAAHRTKWALSSGLGRIHPWMVPGEGGDIGASPEALTEAEWKIIEACLTAEPGAQCSPTRLYTEAPAPESTAISETRLADPAGPQNLMVLSRVNRELDNADFPLEVDFNWQYLNSLGGVPTRDDVRFHMAIKEVEIPIDGTPPTLEEYPTLETTQGEGALEKLGEVYQDRDTLIIKDIAYFGHLKLTDPVPATSLRDYKVTFPAKSGKRYLLRLMAKRFCFDLSDQKYSVNDHVRYIDTNI